MIYFKRYFHLFFYLLFFWLGLFFYLLAFDFDKINAHLWINQFHTSFLDAFVPYFTHLGDGIFMIGVIFIFFFISTSYFWQLLLSGLFLTPLIYGLKKFFDHDRPVRVFKTLSRLGELYSPISFDHLNVINSFPSGHAAVSFCLCVSMVLLKKNQTFFWILLAVFLSFSRVYLSQHFVEDIFFGSFVGSFMAILVHFILDKQNFFHQKRPVFKSLFNFFIKKSF